MVSREIQTYLQKLVAEANGDMAAQLDSISTIKLKELTFNEVMMRVPDKRNWQAALTYLVLRFPDDGSIRKRFKEEALVYASS